MAGAQVRISDRRRHGELMLLLCSLNSQAYLSHRGFVHRDLAARNVLVKEDVAKVIVKIEINYGNNGQISDFGLCRHQSEPAENLDECRLPVKWMALEALQRQHFDTRTDV